MNAVPIVTVAAFSEVALIAKGVVRFQAAYRGHKARKELVKTTAVMRPVTAAGRDFSVIDKHALKVGHSKSGKYSSYFERVSQL